MKDNFDNEEWRDVEGYDGAYQVSDLGRVRSKKYGRWKVLKAKKRRDGYLHVGLWKDGKKKWFLVHRLVAQAFIDNDNIFNTEINHRNECKSDNRASNLEWCDRSYNVAYNGLQQIRYHPKHKRDKVKDLYNPNLTYEQNLELFMANGISCSRCTICRLRKELGLINNKTKRDEIKPFYNPNLSIKQNLELFKSKGIECGERTVRRLRKDLGLAKHIE